MTDRGHIFSLKNPFSGKMPAILASLIQVVYRIVKKYGKCSKILNTSSLPKRSRQTGQTQIRLLLKKQSDQGFPCLLF